MCVCLVFQLQYILFIVIKIIIHVAILIHCTKHALNSLSFVKGDPQNKQNEFKYEHFPISNEKEKKGKKETEKANGISCMNPYPMKMKKSKMNFKYEQWKFTSEEM